MAVLVKTVAGLAYASTKTVGGQAVASIKNIMGVDTTASASYTLLYDCYTASNFAFGFGDSTGEWYFGTSYNDATGYNLSKVTYKLTKGGGSITSKTYKVRLWDLSGTSLNNELAVSSGVSGDDSWSATSVDFIFVTPYTTTGGVDYAWTINVEGSADAVNFAQAAFNSTAGMPSPPASAALRRWTDTKTQQGSNAAFSSEAKVYKSP